MIETIATSKAGATIPVMSSSLSQETNINAAIPAIVKALSEIAQYLKARKKYIEPGSIFVA